MTELTAQQLKDRMLARIEQIKDGSEAYGENVTHKELFLIEHFVKSFPVSAEGKEVKD